MSDLQDMERRAKVIKAFNQVVDGLRILFDEACDDGRYVFLDEECSCDIAKKHIDALNIDLLDLIDRFEVYRALSTVGHSGVDYEKGLTSQTEKDTSKTSS